jgi:hypothetical protein
MRGKVTTKRKPNTGRTFIENSRLKSEVRCDPSVMIADIHDWCDENAKGRWAFRLGSKVDEDDKTKIIHPFFHWVAQFELKDDAALFKLFFG